MIVSNSVTHSAREGIYGVCQCLGMTTFAPVRKWCKMSFLIDQIAPGIMNSKVIHGGI